VVRKWYKKIQGNTKSLYLWGFRAQCCQSIIGATEKRRESEAVCKDIGNLNQRGERSQFIRDVMVALGRYAVLVRCVLFATGTTWIVGATVCETRQGLEGDPHLYGRG
jgi:hypothetical protein